MKLMIDISKDCYDAIMARDWKNAGWLFSEELKAIHDGKIVEQEPCEDAVSRQAALDAMSDTWKHICSVARRRHPTKAEEAVYSDMWNTVRQIPPVTSQQKIGYISIDDVMSVFDDFMCGEVDEDGMDTFLEMLKDKAESEE